jgi:toxin-antitoxin system PIN domain toxin
MTLAKPKYLLDVNVLIALTEPDHIHHKPVMKWFDTQGLDWGLCAFSEAGFLRVSTNPKVRAHSVEESTLVLANLANRRGYRYWPITTGWADLAALFGERVFGHQQITDAYLLGLAVKENGILVTLDRAISYMAGPQYRNHLLVLGS